MAAQQFVIASDYAGGVNKFLLVSDSAQAVIIDFVAQQGQQGSADVVVAAAVAITPKQPQQSSASLISWAYTTLVAPIYTGPGSIFYGGYTGSAPAAGDIVAYDPTFIVVNSDGTVSSSTYGSAPASYNDGTGWYPFTITFAAWDVNPAQSQQAAAVATVAAQIAFTAQQGQQSAINVVPISGIATQPQQSQQAAASVVVAAQVAFAAQQGQQVAADARVSVNPAINPQQRQQGAAQIVTAAQVALLAQQGQQSAINVLIPSPIAISFTAQQGQQGAAAVVGQSFVAITALQPQQASINVLVPPAVAIAMTAQQGQQAAMQVSAAVTLAMAAQQAQQAAMQAAAAVRASFSAQQGQQVTMVLPNLGAPVIQATSGRQAQQISADVLTFPVIGVFAQQAQQAAFKITPLPAQLPNFDPEGISFQLGGYLPTQQDNTKVIYLGRDNSVDIGVLYYGLPLDLGAMTQIQLRLDGTGIVIDSNDSPDYMSWQPGSNIITFKIGMVPGVEAGIYPIVLTIYDFAHPNGQTIAGPGLPLILFDFEQDRVA